MTTASRTLSTSSEPRSGSNDNDREFVEVEHTYLTKSSVWAETSDREGLLDVLLDNAPVGVCVYDAELKLILCNAKLRQHLGYPDELFEVPVLTMEDLFRFNAERGEYGSGDIEALVAERLDRARQGVNHIYERTRPNGMVLEVRGVPLASGGFVTIYSDVTEQRQRVHQLEAVIENFPGGICLFDQDLEMALHNRALIQMLDYPTSLFENGKPSLEQLFRFNAARGEYGPGNPEEQVQQRLARLQERHAHEYRRQRPDGSTVEVRGVPIKGSGFLSTYVDVTEQSRNQELIAHMAHHDGLTDLPNRILLMDRLKSAVAQSKRGNPAAVHYLDLDKFKPVNDTYGHDVGDQLLQAVADRLRNLLRETDTVARLGGDEFVIVQIGIRKQADAETLATRVIETLCSPFELNGQEINIATSIGISLAPEHSTRPEELLKLADQALYAAKSGGRRIYKIAQCDTRREA